jgi:5-(carboxyamino)imidazole ribonucleotide synthase
MSTAAPVEPPAMIGMLGGGQLGRYALMAARVMGYRTAVLDPDPAAPAAAIADLVLTAPFDDERALTELGDRCEVVTTEFENPPAASLQLLARRTRVAPSPEAVAIAQDRIREKSFLRDIGMPVGGWAVVDDLAAEPAVRYPAILKTARMGYDGKGQRLVADVSEMRAAWRLLGSVPCVLEEALLLETEVSVVVARTATGCRRGSPTAPPAWRWRSPTRSTTSVCSPSRCSWSVASSTSTSSLRDRTTAGTGRSTSPRRASSRSRCARCAASVSATRR